MVSKFDPFDIHDIFIYRKPNLKVIPILLVDSDVMTTKEIFYLQNDNMHQIYAKKNQFDFVYECSICGMLTYHR